ncbi:hypothetical protein [Luteolibacter marinus]|uniref:hypothetical protein n=1 Tax=Luteolibacter marinus TaxID=2776705 RepID=UPI0018696303|nr:hypothetical protein [Luteolibacter marinus]
MSVSEILEICQALPPDKREAVADFARFLLSREKDLVWEAQLADSKPRIRPEPTSPKDDAPFDSHRILPDATPAKGEPGPFGTVIHPERP